MVKVSGNLWDVGKAASRATQVRVHAAQPRTLDGGLVTTEDLHVDVHADGSVRFEVLPGMAVMHLVGAGRNLVGEVKLLVPAHDATLEECINAVGNMSESSRRELEEWVWEIRNSQPIFEGIAREGVAAAVRASRSEQNAAESADAAGESAKAAAGSAEDAEESASAASTSASNASDHASKAAGHEVAAKGYAGDAEASAGAAQQEAERAATIAGSTRWIGTRLAVNERISPDLMPKLTISPQGTWVINGVDTGQPARGPGGASDWADISGKPEVFPPAEHTHNIDDLDGINEFSREFGDALYHLEERTAPHEHTHTSSQVTDAVNDAGDPKFGGKLVKGRDSDGKIFYYQEPTEGRELSNKSYVDRVVGVLRAEVGRRPALFSGYGPPPRDYDKTHGAGKDDWYMDLATAPNLEIYRFKDVY